MSISILCAHCSRPYDLPESMIGKQVRCKECKTVFRVQARLQLPPLCRRGSRRTATDSMTKPRRCRPVAPRRTRWTPMPCCPDGPRPSWPNRGDSPRQDRAQARTRGTRRTGPPRYGRAVLVWVWGYPDLSDAKLGFVLARHGVGMDPAVQIVIGAFMAAVGALLVTIAMGIALVQALDRNQNRRVDSGDGFLWVLAGLMTCAIGFAGLQTYLPGLLRAGGAVARTSRPTTPRTPRPAAAPIPLADPNPSNPRRTRFAWCSPMGESAPASTHGARRTEEFSIRSISTSKSAQRNDDIRPGRQHAERP